MGALITLIVLYLLVDLKMWFSQSKIYIPL